MLGVAYVQYAAFSAPYAPGASALSHAPYFCSRTLGFFRPGRGHSTEAEAVGAPPPPELALAAGVPAEALALDAPRRRVLYIEDNEVNQMLMEGMLSQRPQIALAMAALPLEGLALASHQPPELVLLDIQLPGMDGYEVLRQLRLNPATQAIPVVAVSANALAEDRAQAAQAGFAAYITKPIDMALLLAVIDRLLG